jgi:hypothetical protein
MEVPRREGAGSLGPSVVWFHHGSLQHWRLVGVGAGPTAHLQSYREKSRGWATTSRLSRRNRLGIGHSSSPPIHDSPFSTRHSCTLVFHSTSGFIDRHLFPRAKPLRPLQLFFIRSSTFLVKEQKTAPLSLSHPAPVLPQPEPFPDQNTSTSAQPGPNGHSLPQVSRSSEHSLTTTAQAAIPFQSPHTRTLLPSPITHHASPCGCQEI